MTLDRGGEITAGTFTAGRGGNISLVAGTLNLFGGAISALTEGVGHGGNIKITTGSVMLDEAIITVASRPSQFDGVPDGGVAGSLAINAKNAVMLLGGTEITAGTFTTGSGGDISLIADAVSLKEGSLVSAFSVTTAPAGAVWLNIGSLELEAGSSVNSASFGPGASGSVTVIASGPIAISGHSNLSTSAQFGTAAICVFWQAGA